MNEKGIGTCLDQFIQKEIWIRNHEMDFEGQRSHLSKRPHDRHSHRNVGHEMAIHDVNVNAVGSCPCQFLNLCRQMAEVGSENRGCEFYAASVHPALLFARSKMPTN